MTLKATASCGLELFVAFIGLQNVKLIIPSASTIVTYKTFKGEDFHSAGIGPILALLGVLIIAILLIKKKKSTILLGIIITWILGILCELLEIYRHDPDLQMYS